MVRNYIRKKEPYDKEAMQNAIKAVQSGEMGYKKAASVFGVKRETVRDQVRKRYKKLGAGRETYLTVTEEDEIAECLKIMARWGFGFTQTEVLHLTGEYAATREPNNPFKAALPSHDWLYGFFRRHPTLTRRLPEQLKSARAKSSANENILNNWFQLVKETLEENGLMDSPHRVFNVDETGMPLDPKRMRVVCEKNISHLFRVIGGSGRESITVNGCASADGKMLPPYVIYSAKNLRLTWMEGGPEGCRYTATEKGWMDTTAFLDWFEKLFIPHLPEMRPIVLIFDGHKSHISVRLIQSAVQNKIILLKLPPNSTHTLQPLDVGVYGPLKTSWEKILISFARQNLGAALNKEIFPSLLKQLWTSGCLTATNIKAGFSRCGIFPFNPSAVPRSLYEAAEIFDKVAPSVVPLPPSSSTSDAPSSSNLPLSSSEFDAPSSSNLPLSSSESDAPSSSILPSSSSSESGAPSLSSSNLPSPSSSSFGLPSPSAPSSSSFGTSTPTAFNSRQLTPSEPPTKLTIKDFFLKKISPILHAKKEKEKRKTVQRQYGESLTSLEYIERMTREEEERQKKGKGKGKRSIKPKSIEPKRVKKAPAPIVSESESDIQMDDDLDKDWVPPRRQNDKNSTSDNDDSDFDSNNSITSARNIFNAFA